MPEGDTIHRAARTLAAAVQDELVTGSRFHPRTGVQAAVVTGRTVRLVEPRGKHLLLWLSRDGREDVALHTHLRMSGSWHVYEQGRAWSRPERQATAVLETAGWAAVCFNAPVCELLTGAQVAGHPALAALGPDLAAPAPDVAEVRRRMDAQGHRPLLDVLLDQRVFAGVGNVYKSELCWLHQVHPLTPVERLDGALRDVLIADAARLLALNVAATSSGRVTTTAGEPGRLYVYGRAGKPCRRCGSPIRSALLGEPARRTAWCPRCQPAP